jgi:hypothetical protein
MDEQSPPIGDHEAQRREQRERLELYLIGVFKAARRIDLADDAAAMRRIVDLAVKTQIDHEANPRVGLEANLSGGASSLDLNLTLTPGELAAVFSGKLQMRNSEIARDTETVRGHERSHDSDEEQAQRQARAQRERGARIARNVFIVVGLVVAAIVASLVAWVVEQGKEKRHDEHESHDKHEMHR